MHIVSYRSDCPIDFTFVKSWGSRRISIAPGVDYVFSNIQRAHLSRDEAVNARLFRQSHLEGRLRPFRADFDNSNGKRVLFYAGAGGYGDQLMAWPVARVLRTMGYVVDVLCDPLNEPLWQDLPFVHAVIGLPVPLRDLNAYDHLAFYEFVTNADGHPGQMHPTDNLLYRMGIDPQSVTSELKRIEPPLTAEETLGSMAWADRGICQLGSSSPLRNLPAAEAAALPVRLAEATGIPWTVIGDDFLPKEYYDRCRDSGVQMVKFQDVREAMAAVFGCRLSVGPDSFAMHVRGMANRAAVAYFGPMSPQYRTAYYPSVRAIWRHDACIYAPCLAFTHSFPAWCPGLKASRCEVSVAGAGDVVAAAAELSKV